MNIRYVGASENNKDRFILIDNVKQNEVNVLEDYLNNNNIKYDGFGSVDNATMYYINIFDKDEYEDFKEYNYKELKIIIKGGNVNV